MYFHTKLDRLSHQNNSDDSYNGSPFDGSLYVSCELKLFHRDCKSVMSIIYNNCPSYAIATVCVTYSFEYYELITTIYSVDRPGTM